MLAMHASRWLLSLMLLADHSTIKFLKPIISLVPSNAFSDVFQELFELIEKLWVKTS